LWNVTLLWDDIAWNILLHWLLALRDEWLLLRELITHLVGKLTWLLRRQLPAWWEVVLLL
jgi:hypothetical protein